MFKKAIVFFVAAMMLATIGSAGIKEKRAKLPVESPVYTTDISIPSVKAAKSTPTTFKANATPAEGVVIGSTDYDYGWNSGWSRAIQTYGNGAHVHMGFNERNSTLVAPANRRAYKYVYYNNGNLVTAYPRPKATGATGFGNVDVFQTGDGAGTAIMSYHTPNFFAIDGGPGLGTFTEVQIPASVVPNSVTDPEVTIDNATGTIYWEDSKNRTDYNIAKSTDFGVTWTYVDSLMKYVTKGQVANGLDNPLLVAPNGNLILATTLTGKGSIAPLGSSHTDSSDVIGAFVSTNKGTSWTWSTWGKDGEAIVVAPGDTVYALFENFGGMTAVVGKNNVIHMTANGYCQKLINDSTASNRFYTLYKNSTMSKWKVVSNVAAGSYAEYDSSYYSYNGNAIGNAYPSVSVDTNGTTVFASWSQAIFNAGKMDTTGGFIQYELWWNFSGDGGTSWGTPTKVPNSTGALFAVAAERLSHNGTSRTAHINYLADTARGSVVFDGQPFVQTPHIYRTVTFTPLSVSQGNVAPEKFELSQNYPNPFNPTTNIKFTIGNAGLVTLKVFNAIGQQVATLVNEHREAGAYEVSFNASKLASGVYMYKIESGSFSSVKKMVLMK